jgi:hypothetical protein
MGRRAARALYGALCVVGAVLYFLFVIPRWWVLTGDFPTTLGTAGRIAAGVPIALAAIPVMVVLKGSLGTRVPELALRLRAWSAVLHVVAGVLVLAAAIAEIWLRLESAGPWLFALYGAAAAIALLGILAFWLSFVAEQPPEEPEPAKPAKPAKEKKQRRFGKRGTKTADADADADADENAGPDENSDPDQIGSIDDPDPDETGAPGSLDDPPVVESPQPDEPAPAATPALRNKRPAGKTRHRMPR